MGRGMGGGSDCGTRKWSMNDVTGWTDLNHRGEAKEIRSLREARTQFLMG